MNKKRTIPWIEWGKWDVRTAEEAINKQRTLNKRRSKNKKARAARKKNR